MQLLVLLLAALTQCVCAPVANNETAPGALTPADPCAAYEGS